MMLHKVVAVAGLSALVFGASVSSASAHRFHHWGPGPFGIVGAVVVGAATLATAPIAIVGGALSGGYEREPRYADGYRQGPSNYYGPRERFYGPRRFYGRPRYNGY